MESNLLGQKFGNYRLIRLLGEGGFAKVYLAENIHIHTMTAIKVLHTQLGNDEVERFRDEGKIIAQLYHPHIVRILDFGVENWTPYLIMDYAPNGTLRQRHPLGTAVPRASIVSYIQQVASALQYAHNQKFIHRDIKPDNMLLSNNDDILLSDFGIARIAQNTQSHSAQVGQAIGTPHYMAPEQLQGKSGRASDQYALGIVTYEWLCGERPFQGAFAEILSQHMLATPPSLQEKNLTISPAIETVVFKALEKDPHERFACVQDFADALEQACDGASTFIRLSPGDISTYISPKGNATPEHSMLIAPEPDASTFVSPMEFPANGILAQTKIPYNPPLKPNTTKPFVPVSPIASRYPDGVSKNNQQLNLCSYGFLTALLGVVVCLLLALTDKLPVLFLGSVEVIGLLLLLSIGIWAVSKQAMPGILRRSVRPSILSASLITVLLLNLIAFVAQPSSGTQPLFHTSTPNIGLTGTGRTANTTPSLGYTPSTSGTPSTGNTTGTELYHADWSKGLNGWNGGSQFDNQWKVSNGMLTSVGTIFCCEPTYVLLLSPYTPGNVASYAVETRMQITQLGIDGSESSNGSFWGIFVHMNTDYQGYLVGMDKLGSGGNAFISSCLDFSTQNPDITKMGTPVPSKCVAIQKADDIPGTDWHTYRVEIKNASISFYVDNIRLFQVTDTNNAYPNGGQVGIVNLDNQIAISSFRITSL